MNADGQAREFDAHIGRVFVLLLGLATVAAINALIEPIATLLRSRYRDPATVGPWPDLILFAAAVLPLACVHTRQGAALRVALTHGGVFALLATLGLYLSPASPMFMDAVADRPHDYAVWFAGPIVAWGALAVLGVGAALVVGRSSMGATWRVPILAVALGALFLAQAMSTIQFVSGGWLLLDTQFPWWVDATKLATGAAYAAIAAGCMWGAGSGGALQGGGDEGGE